MKNTASPFLLKLPKALIYSRLFIGFVIIAVALCQPSGFCFIIVGLMLIGLLTDVFDGIFARRFNVSTEKLRRMDSTVDQIFWLSAVAASAIMCFDFWKANFLKLVLVLGFEAVGYIICFVRFRKEIATHALLAKFWAITVLAALIDIQLHCSSSFLFDVCVVVGIAARLEIIAILLIIREWTNDIPTFYHAIKLRQGKDIRRNKLFNG